MQPPFPSLTSTWHNATYPSIEPSQPNLSVAGKTVLITGGGRGIGSRIAHAFAKAGASVIGITGRNESALQSTKASIQTEYPSTKVLTFTTDVVDEAAVNAAFAVVKEASKKKQGIDIGVLNAGYFQDASPIAPSPSASATESSETVKEWWKGFETNVLGSYITTRAFLNNMNAKSSSNPTGPILIAASTAGICFFPPPPTLSGYVTSKVASAQFFQSVAAENPDLRVINFHPGVVETEMGKKGSDAGLKLPVDDSTSSRTSFLNFDREILNDLTPY
jgi:NAD(P)-dependent dehydrogenase (short-subunit alcohol dehydrogenase family)